MIIGQVGGLFHPSVTVFSTDSPMRQHFTAPTVITALPKKRSERSDLRDRCGRRGTLVVGKRGAFHLVLWCADGQKRSFGEGTTIEYTRTAAG